MNKLEQQPSTSEKHTDTAELESINREQREAMRSSLEHAEHTHKTATKEALREAKNEALREAKKHEQSTAAIERSPAQRRHTLITKHSREQSFNKQMSNIQPQLTNSERLFSQFIHNKVVENTSEAFGRTVARPNALLAGSAAAFILTTAIYLLAKHYGYQLSGFETIVAFAIGWVCGLIFDYMRLLIQGKRS